MTDADRQYWEDIARLIPGFDPWRDSDGYRFDHEAAKAACDFFPSQLVFVEGPKAWTPFILEDWQKAIVANLFGWLRESNGCRRFEEVLLYVARKNGKSPLGAGIAVYVFMTEDEAGMQCYSAAKEAKQAGIIFGHFKAMVEHNPDFRQVVKIFKYSIAKKDDERSFYRPVSSEGRSKHGANPYLAYIDELWACERDLVESFTSGGGARDQNLIMYFTTAGVMGESICNEKYDYACRVRDGSLSNPRFLPVIYEITRKEYEDDPDIWKTETGWRKANPNLGVSKRLDWLASECEKAKEIPAAQSEFLRLHCNLQTETESGLISVDKWNLGNGKLDISIYAGRQTAGAGLDLGNTSDLTSLCLCFDREGGGLDYFWWNWMPKGKATVRERKDRVPYFAWARDGWVKLTPGDEVYYAQIRADINEVADIYGIPDLAVDRLFQGVQMCQDLADDGLEITAFGQGFLSMAGPTLQLVKDINSGQAHHGDDPVARFAAANTMVKMDPAGNMKPDKDKSGNKIDPIVAMVMARGQAMERDTTAGQSVYDKRGLITL